MNAPLFRQEVLEHRASRWAGNTVLIQPVSMWLAGWLAAAFIVALTSFACLGEYTRKVRVAGQLVPSKGVLRIAAPQTGRIVSRSIAEGDSVRAGQILYELAFERAGQQGDIDQRIDRALDIKRTLLEQEHVLQTSQLLQQQQSLGERINLCHSELVRIAQEIALQQARVASADKTLARYLTLREQGFISELQLNQLENDRNEQLARARALERGQLTASRELLQLKDESRQIGARLRIGNAQNGTSSIARIAREGAAWGVAYNKVASNPTISTATAASSTCATVVTDVSKSVDWKGLARVLGATEMANAQARSFGMGIRTNSSK